jgi:hypothetical protein
MLLIGWTRLLRQLTSNDIVTWTVAAHLGRTD